VTDEANIKRAPARLSPSGDRAERAGAQPAGRTVVRARRVLVVDDNADAADSLADLLGMLGHATEVAYDGPSALEKALATRPDVVLCDIGLPGMSGYDVARALRERGANDMQLIAVSGYAQREDVQRSLDAGFDDHIAKPADLDKIELMLA